MDSVNSNAYIGKGLINQTLRNYKIALDNFNKALSINKTYEGFLNRAVLKMELQDLEEAWADLEEAEKINPMRIETYINKGIIQMNSGSPENAIIEFNKVLEKEKNYQAYLYRAVAKMNLSDYKGALGDLNTSVQLKPSASAYYYRGISNIHLGNKTMGCSDLKLAKSLGNKNAIMEIRRYCK